MSVEVRTPSHPDQVIQFKGVEFAVKKDKGEKCNLINYSIINFAKKGDNYASHITSILANTENSENDEKEEISYVVKVNPCRTSEVWNGPLNDMFIHEGTFLYDMAPCLTQVLKKYREDPLRVPKCYYHTHELKNEYIIMEDLRKKNFKMIDRRVGLNVPHTVLILNELARMHASSHILEKESNTPLEKLYPFLAKQVIIKGTEYYKTFDAVITKQIETSIIILKEYGGYERGIEILESMKTNPWDIYNEQIFMPVPDKFRALSHGDCWSNNFLFR